ncbi:RNA polymerase sigma factor [Planomonospora sp. ID82291]|uniref:RNA polymerase sigma factor n=1 Tax=Planomonospora sp. ID82291 TaxID=2738136 RepID=UPI0018C37892|nr:RNA polymerase sigma factor [Planomonospora sp. ID82291]MBG0815966.1 RNA polymerase sigma factor [Planomonospora sp. ID82291]
MALALFQRAGTPVPLSGGSGSGGPGGPASDAALIEGSLTDPDGFAGLFDRHSDEIHRYAARRLDDVSMADDVTAETFLVAFRKRARYDLSRADARPWLYGIASNLISGHRRAETRRLKALARSFRHAPDRAAGFEERSAERVTADRLRPVLAAALARLSSAERDLLLLVAWADLTYEEAAEALGIPVGTVRSRLSRTRAKIRRSLDSPDSLDSLESHA